MDIISQVLSIINTSNSNKIIKLNEFPTVVVKEHQHWRILSATFSHISIIHLLFNTSSLWSLRHMESIFGFIGYFRITFILSISSMILMIIFHGMMFKMLPTITSERSFAVGFSW